MPPVDTETAEPAARAADWTPALAGRDGPKYAAIADALAEAVRDGTLPAGAKLPPQRALAWRLGVTLGTVTRAYREAEQRGLVAGTVGRGTFVRHPATASDGLSPPGGPGAPPGPPWTPPAPFGPDNPAEETGPIALRSNVPPPCPAEIASLRATLGALADAPEAGELLAYQPPGATARALAAGAAWFARRGHAVPDSRIALSSGAHNGLLAVLSTVLRPGQRILTERYSYPGLRNLARMLGLEVVPGDFDAEGLTEAAAADALAHGRADALYLVPTLQNPTNAVMSTERRAALAALCERHGVPVVEDDLCGLLPADAPAPLAAHAPTTGYCVTSLSKTLAPGLRVGYIATPPRMREAVVAAVRASTWMASPITAEIATRWIADGTADAILAERRAALARRADLAREIMAGHAFHLPEGALHLWLSLPADWRPSRFVAVAAARDVLLADAHAFTVGRGAGPNAVRLCLGPPRSDARLEDALTRLRDLLDDEDPHAINDVM